jgi:hypothetical protein
MTPIQLADNLRFGIEHYEKRTRLIVYKEGVENVCRRKPLETSDALFYRMKTHLFTGRLQLHKDATGIGIKLKEKL